MQSKRMLAAVTMLVAAMSLAATPVHHVRAVASHLGGDVDRWIVGLDDQADVQAMSSGMKVTHTFEHALNGFAAIMTEKAARSLAADADVLFVERDRTFTITAELPTGVDRIDGELVPAGGVGSGRIVDVDVAVIDTGIDTGHRDLDVVAHVNCVTGGGLLGGLFGGGGGGCEAGGSDDHGHGTHVAGTAAARDNGLDVVGVAPGARLWGVKVLNAAGTGTTSDIVAGIDWVAARADQVEVINMSLGGSGTSSSMNTAIANATNAGIVVVVAAGNDSANAGGHTPANAPDAVTISAFSDTDGKPGGNGGSCSGSDDSFATYSNYGSVVDLAAPGSCIVSTRNGGGTASKSGTSMASPHAAGAAALYIAENGVPRNGNRKATVLAGLLNEWSVPQSSTCGFTNGPSAEPALHLTACGTNLPDDNDAPVVTIDAPADGHTVDEGQSILFEGTASDTEDGDLTSSMTWTSDVDGPIGTGGSVQATLSAGIHTVTAAVTDSAGAGGSASIQVTVQGDEPPPPAETAEVGNIRWDHSNGFLVFSGWLDAWVQIVDQDGSAIQGASVTIDLMRNGSHYTTATASTDGNGEAYFANDGVPSGGCWSLQVTAVDAGGNAWDGVTPPNEYCT